MLTETKRKTDFWNQLISDSKNLEEPILYKNFFEEPFFTEDDVRDAIFNWGTEELTFAKSVIRVFIKGGLNYRQGQWMYKNMPEKDEAIDAYFNRIFKGEPFGVFLASVGRYNEKITKGVARLMKPLAEAYGFSNFRYSITLIMGNYGFTPFGIHHDSDVGRTLHILSGSGTKQLVSWKRSLLQELTQLKDRTHYENIDELLPHGQSHTFGPNDLYMLPVQHYHIGFVQDFTMDVVITFRRLNPQIQLFEGITQFYKGITDQLDTSPPDYNPAVPIDSSELETVRAQLSDPKWFEKGMKERAARLESNLGVEAQPVFNEMPGDIELKTQGIQINDPYRLVYRIDKDNLDLYVRGRDIKLFNDPIIISFIDQINTGTAMKVSDAIDLFAKAEFEEADALNLIRLLYEYRGVVFAK